ncbi:hypothetical protein FRC12_000437 [Ceratobasidium sp. 428]|nr:hypothetical protein FRC12_000437 [Ceratobasidium sp. 428]
MLTDFGNAVLSLSTVRFTETDTKYKISVRWTAPELMSQESKYSRQADVYALGMTILETLTGEVPFASKRKDAMVICAVALKERPERPECLPHNSRDGDRLWSLLMKCWSHERVERPNASEVRDTVAYLVLSYYSVALIDIVDADYREGGTLAT